MACYAKSVIATALSEVGYQETPKGSNKNKFAAYIDKNYPNFYNGVKNGYAAWCDLFVDYCVLVNSESESEAEHVLCQPKKSAGAGCSFSYDYYKAKGRTGKDPQIGAQIFFGTGKKPTHTGIVVDFNADSVYTVEGNSDDQVKKHTYKRTSSKIFGYGYPRYTEAGAETPVESPKTPDKSIEQLANEVIAGKWGNGSERKNRLTEAGYDYSKVQAKVNDILKGSQAAEKPKTETATKYVVKTYTGAPLRLRAKPNTSSAILDLMANDTVIEVTKVSNGWAETTYKGKHGYCSYSRLVKK